MKKKYTVDNLLSSKEKVNISANTILAPTQLQHLKLQTKEEVKIEKANKLWQSMQDYEKEKVKNDTGFKMSDKQIYDFAVAELKRDGHPVNKSNVDHLIKVVKEEIEFNEESKEKK